VLSERRSHDASGEGADVGVEVVDSGTARGTKAPSPRIRDAGGVWSSDDGINKRAKPQRGQGLNANADNATMTTSPASVTSALAAGFQRQKMAPNSRATPLMAVT